jgi:hypothetical protein
MSIVLHIERLVLDEAVLGGERASKVRAELERELQRQLSSPGAAHVLPGIGSVASLSSCELPAAGQVRSGIGGRIAAAVGQSLGVEAAAHGADASRVNGGRHG